MRRGLPEFYVERATYLWSVLEKYQLGSHRASPDLPRMDDTHPQGFTDCNRERAIEGSHRDFDGPIRLLEVGTGWIHWDAIAVSLLHEVEATLVDVWDNRQLGVLQAYVAELQATAKQPSSDRLRSPVARGRGLSDSQVERIEQVAGEITQAASFAELYQTLGFRYIVEPTGTLSSFPDEAFDLVVSGNVLQHVKLELLDSFVRDFHRVLKPGGLSVHTIDLADQLAYYDPRAPAKAYLRFSDRAWKGTLESELQYFNRVQRPAWLELFQAAGLELMEEASLCCDLDGQSVAAKYSALKPQDLACRLLRVVHRKT